MKPIVDTPSISTMEFLDALVASKEVLIEMAQQLRMRPEVLRASQGVDFRKYTDASYIEGFVDIELMSDQSVTWWFEIRWGAHWLIDARILINSRQGQDVLRELPQRKVFTLSGCISEFAEAMKELSESVDSIDFENL